MCHKNIKKALLINENIFVSHSFDYNVADWFFLPIALIKVTVFSCACLNICLVFISLCIYVNKYLFIYLFVMHIYQPIYVWNVCTVYWKYVCMHVSIYLSSVCSWIYHFSLNILLYLFINLSIYLYLSIYLSIYTYLYVHIYFSICNHYVYYLHSYQFI